VRGFPRRAREYRSTGPRHRRGSQATTPPRCSPA
jgi:hypothetical protein